MTIFQTIILAVVLLYRKRLLTDIEGWKRIMVAFVPTAIIGFLLYKIIKTYLLGNSSVVVFSLLAGGIGLIIIEKFFKLKGTTKNFSSINIPAVILYWPWTSDVNYSGRFPLRHYHRGRFVPPA